MDSAWLPIDHVRLILFNLMVRCFDLAPWVIEQEARLCGKMAQCETSFALFLPGHADHVEITLHSIVRKDVAPPHSLCLLFPSGSIMFL